MSKIKSIGRYIPVDNDWIYRFSDNTIYLNMCNIDLQIKVEVKTTWGTELWTEFCYLSKEALEKDWNYVFENLFLAIPDYITRDAFLEHGFIDKNIFQEFENKS